MPEVSEVQCVALFFVLPFDAKLVLVEMLSPAGLEAADAAVGEDIAAVALYSRKFGMDTGLPPPVVGIGRVMARANP